VNSIFSGCFDADNSLALTLSLVRPNAARRRSFHEDFLKHKIDSYLMVRKKWVIVKKWKIQSLALLFVVARSSEQRKKRVKSLMKNPFDFKLNTREFA